MNLPDASACNKNLVRCILFSLLMGFTFNLLSIEAEKSLIFNEQTAQGSDYKTQAYCTMLCNSYRALLEQVDACFEHAALIINNNQVPSLDKKKVIPQIFERRQFIRPYKENKIATATVEYTKHLAVVTDAIIHDLEMALEQSFINLPSFDPDNLQTRSGFTTEKLEDLEGHLKTSIQAVETLDARVENIGLNFINRAFRKLEKLDHKYKIVRKIAWTGGLSLFATFVIWKLDPAWPKMESIKNTLRGWIGKLPFVNSKSTLEQKDDGEDNEETTIKEIVTAEQHVDAYHTTAEKCVNYKKEVDKLYEQELRCTDPEQKAEIGMQIRDLLQRIVNLEGSKTFDEPNNPAINKIWSTIDRVGNNLGIYSLTAATAWFVIPDMLKAPITHKVLEWWTLSKRKAAEYASVLRGGPRKKVLNDFEKEAKATFEDVIGNEEAKEKLMPIIMYVANFEDFDRSGIVPLTGILCIGAPRTGKTFIAEAVHGEIKRLSQEKVRMLELNAAELKSIGISKFFDIAEEIVKETGPIILLIDEIDTGGFMREGDSADNTALCELLTALSKLNRQKGRKIIVIACTNKPENMDEALLEAGRFGTHIYFNYPWYHERKEFLMRELRNRTIFIEEEFVDQLAQLTENCSFDQLSQLLTAAFYKAKIRGTSLTPEDLIMAYYEEINRISFTDMPIPESEKHVIAIHQAAQAFCRIMLNTTKRATLATTHAVNPDTTQDVRASDVINARSLKKNKMQYGKLFCAHEANSLMGEVNGQYFNVAMPRFFTHTDYLQEIKVLVAGQVAEKIVNGTTGYIYGKQNQEQAFDIAKFVAFQGLVDQEIPQAYKEEKLQEALALLETCKQEVELLLRNHIDQFLELANALLDHKILTENQMTKILTHASSAPKEAEDIEPSELSTIVPAQTDGLMTSAA